MSCLRFFGADGLFALLRAFVFAFFIAAMKAGRCAKEKLIRDEDNPARKAQGADRIV
jgi:hypothetical protein